MNILFNAVLTPEEIVEGLYNSLGYDELINMIRRIDLQVADCEFTIQIITTLIRELKDEFLVDGAEDWDAVKNQIISSLEE